MNNFKKLALAFSCFLPLFIIFAVKNACVIFEIIPRIANECYLNKLIFNIVMLTIWFCFIILGAIGMKSFSKSFLQSKNNSCEEIIIKNAKNITPDYYFSYFSLFTLTFFAVNPSCILDVLIFVFLLALIIIVYIKNEMWFINPMLNILAYKSFELEYTKKEWCKKSQTINVFARENLSKNIDETFCVSYSQNDFSICSKK